MSNLMQKWMARAVRRATRNSLQHSTAALSAALKASLAAGGVGGLPRAARPSPLHSPAPPFSPFKPFTPDTPFSPPGPAPAPDPGASRRRGGHGVGRDQGQDQDQGQGRFAPGRYSGPQGTRSFKLYLPPQALAAQMVPLPLVVMLHGCTQNPDDFAAGTQMNAVAAAHGFLVLYPEQSAQHQPQRCWNWFKHNHQGRGRGEPALLVGMVQQVMAEHAVDARRIYVAGLSAGGAMAAILGDAYPDLFAAVGVHSGLPPGAAHDLASALAAMQGRAQGASPAPRALPPTIVFHGDADHTVHPVNGERLLGAATRDPAAHVAVEAGPARQGSQGHGSTRYVHRDGSGRVVAERWVVHGAGHAWSGGSPKGSFTDAEGPSASIEMWRFFSSYSLPVGV